MPPFHRSRAVDVYFVPTAPVPAFAGALHGHSGHLRRLVESSTFPQFAEIVSRCEDNRHANKHAFRSPNAAEKKSEDRVNLLQHDSAGQDEITEFASWAVSVD